MIKTIAGDTEIGGTEVKFELKSMFDSESDAGEWRRRSIDVC